MRRLCEAIRLKKTRIMGNNNNNNSISVWILAIFQNQENTPGKAERDYLACFE